MLNIRNLGLCTICHSWPRDVLCTDCVARFAQKRWRCPLCAHVMPEQASLCAVCSRHPPPLSACVAVVDYAYPWVDVVSEFKFLHQIGLAKPLARLMAADAALQALVQTADLLIPMPLAPARLAERGFNQSVVLAKHLQAAVLHAEPLRSQPSPTQHSPAQPSPAQPSPAQPLPAQPSPAQPSPAQPSPAQPSPAQPSPAQAQLAQTQLAQTATVSKPILLAEALLRVRDTAPQFSLDRQQRWRNVEAAFLVNPRAEAKLIGKRVTLVDDVMTTGASLHACAGCLLQAGALSVSAVVFARTSDN